MTSAVWLIVLLGLFGIILTAFVGFTVYVYLAYRGHIHRIFEYKPVFIAPKAVPRGDAEHVELKTKNGRRLMGSYIKQIGERRRGVILFCHEFTADRWLFDSYVGYLLGEGFDVLTFDFCNHGDSDQVDGYDPLQWVTEYEVEDVLAGVEYLKNRPDASPQGIGLFGVSKGGGAGIVAAGRDPYVQAVVTDGAFPTHGTLVYYEMQWVEIYSSHPKIYSLLPRWYYAMIGNFVLRGLRKQRKVEYPRVERGIRRLLRRPLLMIHGSHDNYIKLAIVERMFATARGPKELWVVKNAKHNGCLAKAGDEYRSKVTNFFIRHLSDDQQPAATNITRLVS